MPTSTKRSIFIKPVELIRTTGSLDRRMQSVPRLQPVSLVLLMPVDTNLMWHIYRPAADTLAVVENSSQTQNMRQDCEQLVRLTRLRPAVNLTMMRYLALGNS